MKFRSTPDMVIFVITLIILAIGIIMVYSSSAVISLNKHGDIYYYLKRQLLFAFLGILAMYVTMNIDYWHWRKWAKVILLISFILLIAVLIPGIGTLRNGARSWLGVGAFSIQPSEFTKLAMIMFMADFLTKHQEKLKSFFKGFLPSLLILGSAFALIMLQPDLGTGTVLLGTIIIIIFVAGAKLSHLITLFSIGILGFIGLILAAPYRIQRITSFLDPWKDPLGAGYQVIQSLYAIGPGGLFGLGLGMSRQKFYYIPEPQTDFIFAILSEELGFIGGGFVLLLFLILMWRGIRTAILAPDMFGSLLATGIIGMIIIQVIINISVVISLMPVTGITLPLISYGGSSLTLTLTAIGILLNISRFAR